MQALGRVDVVMPAWNAGRYITAALESVAAQGPVIGRVIVVDDGSTDDTVERVNAFAARHPGLAVTCLSQPNGGPSAARNRGLGLATAEFVALLDADDVWLAGKLERQLALFDHPRHPDLGVVYCDYGFLSEAGEREENRGFRLDPTLHGHIHRRLLWANLIAGSASAVLIRRQCLADVGLFDETLVCAEDWDLWLRLARRYAFDCVTEELVLLRQHPHNAQKNELRMLGGELLFLDKLYRRRQARWYHVWRLRRRLLNCGYGVTSLAGFDSCHPRVLWALSGWRMSMAKAVFRGLSLGHRVWVGGRRRLKMAVKTWRPS